jgi:hypothetical protein
MKHATWRSMAATLVLAFTLIYGCKKTQSDADVIRAGITQHLTSLNTLNLSAMDMDVNNVSIQGTQARAQVTFRPKTGAPPGTGMQVSYQLEKRDSGWFVVKTEGVGGGIEHPAANANPHLQPGQSGVHGNLPNFREMIPSTPATGEPLPPGHPSVGQTAPPDPNAKPN